MKKILIGGVVFLLLLSTAILFPEPLQKFELFIASLYSKQKNPEPQSPNDQSTNKTDLDQEQLNQYLQQKVMTIAASRSPFGSKLNEEEKQQIINQSLEDLYTGDHEMKRELAVITLGALQTQEAKNGILFALNDPDSIVRQQAVIQIRKWPNETERMEMFLVALANNDPYIILLALQNLPNKLDIKLINRLQSLTNSDNRKISAAAQMALPANE